MLPARRSPTVRPMKVLFIGGTGVISTASTLLAAQRGIDLFLLTRRSRPAGVPECVQVIQGDIRNAAPLLREHAFDAVVDWVAFHPDDIERDLALFRGRTRQYIFISSASAYRKPPASYLIREETPLANPFWEYSRNKIACEERLAKAVREEGFPATVVRPSLTFGDTLVPLAVNSWQHSYTAIDRMRKGLPVIVPGDGTSLWTITHNRDFAKGLVGLLGREDAVGETFHITSDEVLTWNAIYEITAAAAGAEGKFVHIPSTFLGACLPGELGSLLGDKAVSSVFDNSKIKKFVPGFAATTSYAEGIRSTMAWFDRDPSRASVDAALSSRWDTLIGIYQEALKSAQAALQKL